MLIDVNKLVIDLFFFFCSIVAFAYYMSFLHAHVVNRNQSSSSPRR